VVGEVSAGQKYKIRLSKQLSIRSDLPSKSNDDIPLLKQKKAQDTKTGKTVNNWNVTVSWLMRWECPWKTASHILEVEAVT
jgi:hypothetical protein